jgi:hypothetical protein
MTAFRQALFAAVLTLTLGACSRDEEPTAAGADNPLLVYVPADTPYVAANLERLPEDVIDGYLQRMQPAIDEMQLQLTALRADLETARVESGGAADADPASSLALAVLSELDGKLSRSGLSSLGLDILSHKVVYGMGAFPVLRLGLSDAELFRATVRRVLENAQIPVTEQTFQGARFWRVTGENPDAAPLGLYLSIQDDHLAAGLLPPAFEAEVLPYFLGLVTPPDSSAHARLSSLNGDHDYTAFGSGILDLHRLADEFLRADSLTARALAATGEFDAGSFSADCASELHEIIDQAPRMTMGTTELSSGAMAYQYRIESPPSLASSLSSLVARMPAADELSDRMLDLSFGMRLGAVRDFLREKAMAIVDDPYGCEQLQDINDSAQQLLAQLDQPMPPFFNNFRGLRIAMNEFVPGRSQLPAGASGHVALHVEQPEMFLGMAQMFLPDLSELALTPGGDPVQIPSSLIPVPDLVTFAAMSNDAIGLAVGAGEEATLKAFLDRPPGPEDMFLSVSYDTAAYLDYTDQLTQQFQGDDGDDPAQAVQAIGAAARDAFRKSADRSLTTLRFAPSGLTIDGRMTFKPMAQD